MHTIMSAFPFPPPVVSRIAQLGDRVRVARIRRGWSSADLALKAGINRNTLSALEKGAPGTSIGVYLAVVWALGLDRTLDGVADPDADVHGKSLEAARRPRRVGRTAVERDDYDF